MSISDIEDGIAAHELTPEQVFTKMRQYVNESQKLCEIYFSIAASHIGSDAVRERRNEILSET